MVKQFGADTVKVADGVRRAIAELAAGLPAGVTLRVVYDQADLVRAALGGVGRAVLLGAVFVVLVIFLLLGNLRAALVVTVTIPLSLALAGLVLRPAGRRPQRHDPGRPGDRGGLAGGCGHHRDREHRPPADPSTARASATGAGRWRPPRRSGRPIAFATLIVVAVFAPLLGMSGIEGRMYKPLAAAVIAARAGRAACCPDPGAAAGALCRARRPRRWRRRGRRLAHPEDQGRLRGRCWTACLRRAGLVRLATLALTLPAIGLAFVIGTDFMPQIDEGALLLQTVLPAEASLDEVDRLNHRVEDVLRKFPEVEDVVRRTGRAERTEDPMPHTLSDVLVVLRPDRRRSREELERRDAPRARQGPGRVGALHHAAGHAHRRGPGRHPRRHRGPDLRQRPGPCWRELGEQAESDPAPGERAWRTCAPSS